MVLSTLLVGTLALVSPALADFDQDDWRVSEAVDLGRPKEWPANSNLFSTCPSSQHRDHTMAQMTVDFTNSCEEVFTELQARSNGNANGSWQDPHNRGRYKVDAVEGNMLKVQRWTRNYEYKDLQTFSLTSSATGGCKMNACSVSQPNSNNSGGTDMCDMENLFCNSSTKNRENGVSCTPVKYNLAYTIPYLQCGRFAGNGEYLQHKCQDFATTCLKNKSTALELPAAAPKPVVLGRPKEWPANSNLFSTCPSSQHRDHTMAQMTVDFTNSCSDVSAEIKARAGAATNGGSWVDPHNRGHYKLLSSAGGLTSSNNLIVAQRWTGNYEYLDLISFSMQTSGTGCKVNACGVSQPNSNNSGGTDMCDMGNLFCNSDVKNTQNGVACADVKYKLSYTVPYLQCGRFAGNGEYLQHNCQDFTTTCLRNTALGSPEPQHILRYLLN